ncbi:MAG TPA: radical SAM family heme chaperone HemW [Alphaproteobacteria bacterium]|nr:coproporphyrinogen III oxidase [Rhodospirillaceae bacterium]HRJ67761.1 radical SAM family heme chaperone HemW [Alphaproteobacteria bacterium]
MLPLNARANETDSGDKGLALYVHWPFCKFKCPYCDFNSHVREKISHQDWRDAYVREMQYYRELTGPRDVQSVFFGGGTPSLMEPETAGLVIDTIADLWGLPQGTEVTLEANPTSVEADKLRGFKSAGVNRVSLGVQALNDADLKTLGRQHSAAEALAAVKMAAQIFDRYSFDLIYARPAQSVADWRAELSSALPYARGHMSLYQLTIEEGTQYHTLFMRGDLKVPDEETAAQMYELTQEMMEEAGMPAYEVSNHARLGDESRHNLVYWRYGDYAGIGPGAHGRLSIGGVKQATRAHRAPEMWLERVRDAGHGAHPFESVDFAERGREALMMGLRLAEGVPVSRIEAETGQDFSAFVNLRQVKILEDEGLLSFSRGILAATPQGRQKLNAVLSFLLAAA